MEYHHRKNPPVLLPIKYWLICINWILAYSNWNERIFFCINTIVVNLDFSTTTKTANLVKIQLYGQEDAKETMKAKKRKAPLGDIVNMFFYSFLMFSHISFKTVGHNVFEWNIFVFFLLEVMTQKDAILLHFVIDAISYPSSPPPFF